MYIPSAHFLYRKLRRLRKNIREQQYTILKDPRNSSVQFGYTDFFKPINGKYYYAPDGWYSVPKRNKLLSYKFLFDMCPVFDLSTVIRISKSDVPFYKILYTYRPETFTPEFVSIICYRAITDISYKGINKGIKLIKYLTKKFHIILFKSQYAINRYTTGFCINRYGSENNDTLWLQIRKNLTYLMRHNVIVLPRDAFIFRLLFITLDGEARSIFEVQNYDFALWAAQFVNYKTRLQILGSMCDNLSLYRNYYDYEKYPDDLETDADNDSSDSDSDDELKYKDTISAIKKFNRKFQLI